MTSNQILTTIKPILDKHSIEKVTVFGSYARGDNKADSDIDIVIDSGGHLKGIMFFVAADELSSLLPVKSDIYEQRELKPGSSLYNEIQKEGVVIYDRQGY